MGRNCLRNRWESFSLGGGKSQGWHGYCAYPREAFGGQSAECVPASQAAGRRGGGDDLSTEGQFCFVCGARLHNRQSDTWRMSGGLTQCLLTSLCGVQPWLNLTHIWTLLFQVGEPSMGTGKWLKDSESAQAPSYLQSFSSEEANARLVRKPGWYEPLPPFLTFPSEKLKD